MKSGVLAKWKRIMRTDHFKTVKERTVNILIQAVIYALCSFLILIFVEAIFRQSFSETVNWITSVSHIAFILNYIFVLGLLLLTEGVFGNLSISFAVSSLIFLIISIINHFKMVARGDVLQLGDIHLVKEALQISSNYDLSVGKIEVCILIFAVIICMMLFFCKYKRTKIVRILSFAAGLTGLVISIKLVMNPYVLADSLYVTETYYENNGLIVGLIRTWPQKPTEPEGYSEKKVAEILEEISYNGKESAEMPDIIVIMNESFYDITLVDGVELSEDPLSDYKKLQEEYVSFPMFSPTIGGALAM